MEKIDAGSVEQVASASTVRRPLADAMGAEHLSMNYYELDPGDSFAFGYHSHGKQEEVFYILSGVATFETEDGDITVGPHEALFVPPGELQQGFNRGDERIVALALGSPRDPTGGSLFRDCPECGERTPHGLEKLNDETLAITTCQTCDSETGRFEV